MMPVGHEGSNDKERNLILIFVISNKKEKKENQASASLNI